MRPMPPAWLLPALLAAAAVAATGHAFAPPSPATGFSLSAWASIPVTAASANLRLRYVPHEDEMGWYYSNNARQEEVEQQDQQQPHQRAVRPSSPPPPVVGGLGLGGGVEGADYEARVEARFSRRRRLRDRLRAVSSYGAELDLRRRELEAANYDAYQQQQLDLRRRELEAASDAYEQRQRRQDESPPRPRPPPSRPPRPLLVNSPVPIVNFRTNSDFPGSDLPTSQWTMVAAPPLDFDRADYSPCTRTTVGLPVLAPMTTANGVGEPPAVVLNGAGYAATTVDDALTTENGERAYWLRGKVCDAIYGRVRHGTMLQRLESPVRVLLPSSSGGGEREQQQWTTVEYVLTDESVAVKEMDWEHIRVHGPELAEDPIKEVSAMQYLMRGLEAEEEELELEEEEWRRAGGSSTSPSSSSQGASRRERRNNHHVMMPLDLLSDDTNLYSVTPFCGGGRLLDVLESRSRFSEPEARYWMTQILEGLMFLKRAGVAHRDMSPENLMVHDGNLYIIDMGMCLRIPYVDDGDDDEGMTNTMHRQSRSYQQGRRRRRRRRSLILPQAPCGKWYYLSPEVLLSELPFDGPTVDLWAAGVILFVMLTGLPPWEEPSAATDENFRLMSAGHLGQILAERRAGLSAEAVDLLQRMFWLDPADRLSLEQVLAHPWMTHGNNPLGP